MGAGAKPAWQLRGLQAPCKALKCILMCLKQHLMWQQARVARTLQEELSEVSDEEMAELLAQAAAGSGSDGDAALPAAGGAPTSLGMVRSPVQQWTEAMSDVHSCLAF